MRVPQFPHQSLGIQSDFQSPGRAEGQGVEVLIAQTPCCWKQLRMGLEGTHPIPSSPHLVNLRGQCAESEALGVA